MDLLTGEAAAPASPEKLPFERNEVEALEDDPGTSDVCKAVLARVEGPAMAGDVDIVPEVEDTARRAGRCRGRACRASTAISQLSDEAFDCVLHSETHARWPAVVGGSRHGIGSR